MLPEHRETYWTWNALQERIGALQELSGFRLGGSFWPRRVRLQDQMEASLEHVEGSLEQVEAS